MRPKASTLNYITILAEHNKSLEKNLLSKWLHRWCTVHGAAPPASLTRETISHLLSKGIKTRLRHPERCRCCRLNNNPSTAAVMCYQAESASLSSPRPLPSLTWTLKPSLFAQFLATLAWRATPLPSLSARPHNVLLPLDIRGAATLSFKMSLSVIQLLLCVTIVLNLSYVLLCHPQKSELGRYFFYF